MLVCQVSSDIKSYYLRSVVSSNKQIYLINILSPYVFEKLSKNYFYIIYFYVIRNFPFTPLISYGYDSNQTGL